jgi:thioesterase domain-containing protein/acyl carrier protein
MHPRKKVRLHRTGDIGRFLPGGDIEILGREDFQVKMNGFRIEVEEIEATILDHNRVSQCAVVVQQTAGSKRLVAFWTSASQPADSVSSVKRLTSTEAAIFKIDQHNIRKLNERTAIRLERQDEETAVALCNARKSCRSFASNAIPLAQLRVIVESACSCLIDDAHDTIHLLSVYMWTKTPMPSSNREANATTRRFEIVATNDGKLQLAAMSNSTEEAQLPVSVATILGGKENQFATEATAIVSIFSNDNPTSPRKALITAGRIGHALMIAALDADASIGVCPIGGLDSRALQSALGLAPSGQAKLLHALVIGPMAAGNVPVSTVPEASSEGDVAPKVELSKPIGSIDLASHVSARLPRYMVPTAFHHIDALPLNLNGKIDRAKLMETVVDTSSAAQNSSDSQLTGAPPSTTPLSATEQKIAEIWMQVLQLPEVGRSQHFDALTESRNLFTRVILRRMICDLMNRAGLILEQATVFECNTIAELAIAVDGTGVVRSDQAVEPVGPISAASDASTTTFTPDQLAIENQLLTIFRDALSLRNEASLSRKDDFFLSGGDSLLAVAATLQIRKKLKIDVPFTAIFNNRTASSMATLLRKDRLADASIVVIQQGTRDGAVPLFLVHPALRTTLTYNRVVEKLDKEQTVYGLEDHRPPAQRCAYTSLEQMATHYVNAISLLMPKDRPVLLGGWSFGAVLGLEIAQQLQASGFAVPLLLMLEVAPTSAIGWFPTQHPKKFEQLETRAQIKHLMAVSMAVWYAFPTRSITGPCTVDAIALARAESNDHRFRYMYQHLLEGVMPLEEGLVYLAQFVDDYVESEQLLLGYLPKQYSGEVVLFSGSDDTKSSADVHLDNFSDSDRPASAGNASAAAASEHRGWAQFIQPTRLEVMLTPGNHDNLLLPPHVDTTSKLLAEVLDRHGFNAALWSAL